MEAIDITMNMYYNWHTTIRRSQIYEITKILINIIILEMLYLLIGTVCTIDI